MKNVKKNYFHLNFYIYALFTIHLIKYSNSQSLNNIIVLSGDNFIYNHISINSDGDMIIDSTSFPISNERKFFGLKKNGEFYFTSINNTKTAYYTMTVENDKGRIEGESSFIKLNSDNTNLQKELILGISKIGDNEEGYYLEL